ncbi:MAG: YcbK family protein [Thermoleophilaceae bacterium]
MSAPWSGHEIATSPFSGEFDAESPFAAVGASGESPAYPAYQEFVRGYGDASTTHLGTEAVSLPLAHESPEQSTVRQAIAGGNSDINKLTNLVFFARHPERNGRGLSPSEPGFATLGAEWATIRDTIVRPLMTASPSPGTTTDLWVPRAERLANSKSAGGTYLDAPWRFVFHTIEGEPSAQGFRTLAANHANPPHLWAMPSANLLLQTIPLNRSAYALARPGSIQTNRLRTIQVEVWGFAAKMVNATPEMLTWLADRVLAPVARLVPINLNQVSPTGPGEPCYGKNSSCRMRPDEWQAYNGVCGHKNVPDNDHWDPGQLDLEAIAARARTSVGTTSYIQRERPQSDHDGPAFAAERDDEGPWQNGHPRMAWVSPSGEGEEGLAEQDEVLTFLEHQQATASASCAFPSGARLRVVSGPTGSGEEHWDPNGSGEPLYDTSAAVQSVQLATNFIVSEFCSSGGQPSDLARISCRLVRNLQKIRDRVGQPVQITSGYRSYKYNVKLYESRGQKPINSQHSSGRAADIATAGMSGLEIAKLAIEICGPNIAVGVANTYAHVDVRGEWARWTYLTDPAESARVIAELDAHRLRVLGSMRVP